MAVMVSCKCGVVARVDGSQERGTALFEFMYPPGIRTRKGWRNPAWASCWVCGAALAFRPIKAKLAPDVRCDHRCTRSKGVTCKCSCGGDNHGINAE